MHSKRNFWFRFSQPKPSRGLKNESIPTKIEYFLCTATTFTVFRVMTHATVLYKSSSNALTENCRVMIIKMYCIVVGSRRLVPPDALQPKAYCTNPGL